MVHEYYFCADVNSDSWEKFLIREQNGTLNDHYTKITGYGWKDKFGINPNGEAFYIDWAGNIYRGIWFETSQKRIAIFKK